MSPVQERGPNLDRRLSLMARLRRDPVQGTGNAPWLLPARTERWNGGGAGMPRGRKGKGKAGNPGTVNRDCAGTGIGRDVHHLAVGPDRFPEPVRSFGGSPGTSRGWRNGCPPAGPGRWRWSRPRCTGSPPTRSWSGPAPGRRRVHRGWGGGSRGAGATCRAASGSGSSWPTGSCGGRSGPAATSARFARTSGGWGGRPGTARAASRTCGRRWRGRTRGSIR